MTNADLRVSDGSSELGDVLERDRSADLGALVAGIDVQVNPEVSPLQRG